MRLNHRHFVLFLSHGLLVLGLTACKPSAAVAEKQPAAVIHGDPIVPVTAAPAKKPDAVVTPVASAPVTTVAAPAPSVPAASDYAIVGFDKLASYNFEVDDTPVTNVTAGADKANAQIPATVKALDDRKVSIQGFMLPLKVSAGSVTEFLIMKNQSMCCYGTVPKITEWVNVKTTGKGVKPIMDQPVSIEGTLHVGATRENGYLIGIYQMDGDKLIVPEN